MEGEKELDLIIKLVHGEGPSRITLDSNRQIASCGLDSISVVFHNGGLEEDNYQFDVESIVGVAGDVNSILDIACYNQGEEYMVAVATDDHTVLSYSYCSGNVNDDPFAESQFKAILVRFTSQINTIDVSSDSSRLAAGASDFLVKMVDLTDASKISTMEGHDAPVLCVRFDPLVQYLASSSCDGTVKIWSTESKVIVYSVDVFPKVNDIIFASTLCRFSWQPGQGQVIAVPVGNGVRLLKRDSWNCIQTVNEQEQDGRNEKFDHVTCWSPCGTVFAVGSSDGRISIYGGWPQPSLISRHSVGSHVVSSLCWDPKTKDSSHPLLFSSSSGHIGALPHHWVYPQGEKEGGKESTAGTNNTAPANTAKATVAEPDDPWFDDSLLLEGIPPDSIFNDEEDAQELANCRPAPSHSPPPLPPPVTTRTTNQINDKRIHDDDNEVAPPTKRRNVVLSDTEEERLDPLSPVISSTVDTGGLPPPPPPLVSSPLPPPPPLEHYHEIFQPSATPSHLTNRFMVYNMVGVVRYHDDGSSPMVEIEFHDSSVHHPLSIPNHYGWTMGALSSKALVLAVEKTEEEPSQFQCTVFSSWDQNKDWSQQLPKGESIEVVALGDSWVAIATDRNYIRLFSLGGTQREVISIPGGQVVSLAGKGDQLIIIYQESTKSSLTAWVLDIGQRRELYPPHHLPLTPQAKLEWIGFSECGVPISYDTKGIVRMFSNQYGLSWLPIVDSSSLLNQKGDHYFVVGMTHNPNEMRVILCKGLDYPPVQPRPVMTTIPLTFPLCDPKTEKTNIEAQCIEKQFVHPPDVMPSPTEMLRTLMQLMAIACRSNHEFRAFELVDMMTLEQGLELALQYASQSGHFRLARQISNLKERRAIAAATEEEEEEEEEINNYYTHRRQAESSSSVYEPSGRSYHDSRRSASSSKSTSQEPKDSGRTPLSARRMLLLKPANKENKPETPEESKEEEEQEEEESKEVAAEASVTNEGGGGGEESDLVSNNSLELINESTDVITGSIDSQFTSPQVSKQRTSNPFKRATPVSKQIQVDRRSSFLDKISQEVQEEKEKEKQKKMKSKLKPANTITTKAKGKKKNTSGSSNNNNAKLAAFAFTKKS